MDYKNVNDYEQLYLISENDDEANNIIFKKYKPKIYSLAHKYYNMLIDTKIDVDDLIQEGYVGLSNAIKTFKESENTCFYTYTVVCIERQMQTYCRKFNSKKNKSLNMSYSIDGLDRDDNITSSIYLKENEYSNNNPYTYLSNSYYNELCINFKHTLPMVESLVFELRCNGFKYKEISNLLDISLSHVDSCVHRIKEKFPIYLNK